ncbi:helix-turn-helix domain-containing protein [Roseibium sp.]|uniref:helix-turn-helix domain-containing protein n=1 Tax=Roseibium sp. TaxID=1936156 RepID=UPI003BB03756
MFVPTDHHRHYVTKEDLIDQAEARPVRWLGPALQTQDDVLRGAIGFVNVEQGLAVHFSNAEDLHDLSIETECGPRLCLALFLEGAVEASIGDFQIPMPVYDADKHRWTPVATVYAQSRTEKFNRQARRGVRLKKVTISISRDWLFSRLELNDPEFARLKEFADSHLANVSWHPSSHAMSLVEQIIAAPTKSPFQQRLYIAARVYALLDEAFDQFSDHHAEPVGISCNTGQDKQKLTNVERYLREQSGHWVTAEELAHNCGMSRVSLQRLLTRTFGLSTARFIRRFMLEKAREALERDAVSIAEAAYQAGYSTPANFSTAFKREFGLSPKQVT